jgi:filamentous hemagglutinin family protein
MTLRWQCDIWRSATASFLLTCGAILFLGDRATAQIIRDTTLGGQSSVVTTTGTTDEISGGLTRGTALFHSFQEFNVENGRAAFFINPVGIDNILGRVTGSNPSNISGTLGVIGGNANLFLINPNGIVFGANASLSLNGSFIGTTANGIGLANGEVFSTNPNDPLPNGLLNVNPSAFFFNQVVAASIVNRSVANSTGLEVAPGKNLLLVGGAVRLEGGSLRAAGGRVELGGVAGVGTIGLTQTPDFRLIPTGSPRADVVLENGASVDVSADGSGHIAVFAEDLTLARGSNFIAGIASGTSSPNAVSGDIQINATGVVSLSDRSTIANAVQPLAVGRSGDVNITAASLSITGVSQLISATFGQGNAGDVNIDIRDGVTLDGSNRFGQGSGILTFVEFDAIGNGGNININTGSLLVRNGAQLVSSTFALGDAGHININARDVVSFDGAGQIRQQFSAAASTVQFFAIGNGGDINITTGSFFLTNSAQLSAVAFGEGNAGSVNITARDTVFLDGWSNNGTSSSIASAVATNGTGRSGNINISTGSMVAVNGAQLVSATFGQTDAGDVNITARDTVSFHGVSNTGQSTAVGSSVQLRAIGNGGDINIKTGSLSVTGGAQLVSSTFGRGNAGDIRIHARDTVAFDGENGATASLAASSVERSAIGNGGDIDIKTGALLITNGAVLNVAARGQGDAGTLNVVANSIFLDNQGSLQASTASGTGGNINLQVRDGVLLRRNSLISARANNDGNGGSIAIETPFIIGVASENSDIIANAFRGRGGSIDITAQGIYGLEFRPELTPQSDISASSRFGLDGTVRINTPDIDRNQGLSNLPDTTVPPSLVAQGCPTDRDNTFVVTGRGGLPPQPSDALRTEAIQISGDRLTTTTTHPQTQIIEAQGWVVDSGGQVSLVPFAPIATASGFQSTPATCYAP